MTDDLEALQQTLDDLTHYLTHAPVENAGTPKHQKKVLAHRMLTDLVKAGGGTPEQRREVMRRLNEM